MHDFFTLMNRMLFQDGAIFVNFNNQATKHFDLHKGVRQGWHLASYLFIIVTKALNVVVQFAMSSCLIKGNYLTKIATLKIISTVRRNLAIINKQLFWSLLTLRYVHSEGKKSSVDNLVSILSNFRLAFRLKTNWTKNVAYQCGRGAQLGWVRKYH